MALRGCAYTCIIGDMITKTQFAHLSAGSAIHKFSYQPEKNFKQKRGAETVFGIFVLLLPYEMHPGRNGPAMIVPYFFDDLRKETVAGLDIENLGAS